MIVLALAAQTGSGPSPVPNPALMPNGTVTLLGVTNTQALFSHADGCTWKISESPTLDPLIHDVDPALFRGSDRDSRPGSVLRDGVRYFLAGTRATERGADGKLYSRALPANTTLYYDVCGTQGSFTTANIPFGSTYADLPPALNPSIQAGTPVVDHQTGAVIKVATPHQNHTSRRKTGLYSGGYARMCDTEPVGPLDGYMCAFPADNGGPAEAYYYVPATGEMRHLGAYITDNNQGPDGWANTVIAYPTAARIVYAEVGTKLGSSILLKGVYSGDYSEGAPGSWLPMTWEAVAFPDGTPLAALKALNPAIDVPPGVSCGVRSVIAGHFFVDCLSGIQDSYTYASGFINIDTRRAVAARPMMTEKPLRFCGEHNFHPLVRDIPVIDLATHGLGTYRVTLTADMDSTTTIANVSGEPAGGPGDILMTAEVGDVFTSQTREIFRMIEKRSPTQWIVERGISSNAFPVTPHRAGERLDAECGANYSGLYWKFLEDPLGKNIIVSEWFDSHDDAGPNLHLTDGYGFTRGPLMDMLHLGPQNFLETGPRYAGAFGWIPGNTVAQHPSYYHQTIDQRWFTDSVPLSGGNTVSAEHMHVSGQLWKYGTYGNVLNRKLLPTLAYTQGMLLKDVSGPGSFIADDATISNTYCVAAKAGECRPDSQAGDVYGNLAELVYSYCRGSDGPVQWKDFCAMNSPMMAQAIIQGGLVENRIGVDPSAPPNVWGVGWSRVLSRGLGGIRAINITAKPTPDGQWLFFRGGDIDEVLMLKIPPFEKQDDIGRSEPIPITVTVPPTSDPVFVEFGYAEFGDPAKHMCTSRNEPCVATQTAMNPGNPFSFRSETQGVPCAAGCTVVIPAVPGHAVYYSVLGKDYLALAP
jgi:hypothetical protein